MSDLITEFVVQSMQKSGRKEGKKEAVKEVAGIGGRGWEKRKRKVYRREN